MRVSIYVPVRSACEGACVWRYVLVKVTACDAVRMRVGRYLRVGTADGRPHSMVVLGGGDGDGEGYGYGCGLG